ncbi:MAG: DsbC family protein [Pseudomonadota bacterium]
MPIKTLCLVAAAFASLLSVGVLSQPLSNAPQADTGISQEVVSTVIRRLKQARPELDFTDLAPSPLSGLYKIKVNGQVAFVSPDGRYMIAGEMYEVRQGSLVNLQEQERQAAEVAFEPQRAELLKALNTDDMVVYTPTGEMKGHVYVFTDIDCGFCRRLHSQMASYLDKGIEIRYLAFPRAGVSSKSAQKLATTWCSPDRQSMMDDFKAGKNMPLKPCPDNPVADQYMLGQEVGVRGTPAIVLASGKIIPGAVSAQYLADAMGIKQ